MQTVSSQSKRRFNFSTKFADRSDGIGVDGGGATENGRMIDRSIDQWSSDNRCLFKRTRDRLTNELRKLIWTKPVAINQFFLFLSFFTPPLSLYYFFFFLFPFSPPLFLQTPLLLVITHPKGRLLNLPSSTRFLLLRFHFILPSFNPERPHVAEKSSSRPDRRFPFLSYFSLLRSPLSKKSKPISLSPPYSTISI